MHSSSGPREVLSRIYGSGVALRNRLFDAGVLRSRSVPAVVVSVGNIEAGGTGKTPFVMALAKVMKARGTGVCIVTRGYKGRLSGPVVVSGTHGVDDVGDEAVLMARSLDVPVIKSPDRLRGALYACAHLGAELVILDDGFQHRWLARDMDIVLVGRNIEGERLLPAGVLREPPASLGRADHILATKGADLPYPSCDLVPVCLVDLDGRLHPLEAVAKSRVLALCAVGSPDGFFSTVEGLCRAVVPLAFPDHHRYTETDAALVARRARGVDAVLTTEKDLVKIAPAWFSTMKDRFFALRVEMRTHALEEIADEIEDIVRSRRVPGQG